MSLPLRVIVFWLIVIAAIRLLQLFPQSLPARLAFSRQGPLPLRGEARSRYRLRWAAYWGSWTLQATLVFAACRLAASWLPSLAESLWFLAFWIAVVPALGAIAFVAGVAALAASAKSRIVGPDPVHLRTVEAHRA